MSADKSRLTERSIRGAQRILPRVYLHAIDGSGKHGEGCYADAGRAVDYLQALLLLQGFQAGTPVSRSGSALQPVPVVEPASTWTELQEVWRNDPGLEVAPRQGKPLARLRRTGEGLRVLRRKTEFLVRRCDEHVHTEFRQFLLGTGCPAAIVGRVGY